MGGKSRKTGSVSKSLIDRIKSGNLGNLSQNKDKESCSSKSSCGNKRRKGNGLGISQKD